MVHAMRLAIAWTLMSLAALTGTAFVETYCWAGDRNLRPGAEAEAASDDRPEEPDAVPFETTRKPTEWVDLPNPYKQQKPAVQVDPAVKPASASDYADPTVDIDNGNLRPDDGNSRPLEAMPDSPSPAGLDSRNLRPSGDPSELDSSFVGPEFDQPTPWLMSFGGGNNDSFYTTPEMFGGAQYFSSTAVLNNTLAFSLSPGGASRRVMVGANNKAMTDNRVYFTTDHFYNAMMIQGPGVTQNLGVERHTFGFERSFAEGMLSFELRAPITSNYQFSSGGLFVNGGRVGNLTAIIKGMLHDTPGLSISTGVGFDTPTGDSLSANAQGASLVIENESVHLLPFLAFSAGADRRVFMHGFLQGDFATNGNTLRFNNQLAVYNEQNLLRADVSLGAWLVRDAYASHLTDLAALVEFHYATSLQDSDVVMINQGTGALLLSNPRGQFDQANFTVGLHGQLHSGVMLRAGWSTPLNETDRFDDGQFTATISLRR